MLDEARERRKMRAMVWLGIGALLVLLASVTPSPFVIERPGPVVDVLGEIEIEGESTPVVRLDGVDSHDTTGEINLLTVTMVGTREHPTDWLSLVPALFDSTQQIMLLSTLFPEGVSDDDRRAMNTALMGSSQTSAAAAALAELGEPVPTELLVAGVAEEGPAEGVLQDGDVVLSAEDRPLASVVELREVVADVGEGDSVTLEIERDGSLERVNVQPERVAETGEVLLGVGISSDYQLPFEVDISLEEIGGPSAGMVFALAIYDRLTPEDLVDGLTVSGTGTIDGAGNVGEIGGLEQKMWGASGADSDLFLMPMANCAELPERIPGGLTVAPVATLGEAVAAVEATAAGDTPPGPELCELAEDEQHSADSP